MILDVIVLYKLPLIQLQQLRTYTLFEIGMNVFEVNNAPFYPI